jgi:hypothetical protein
LYYKGDFDPDYLTKLKEKVVKLEQLWSLHEKKILQLISKYTGVHWLYKEIHVYCFQNAPYYDVPCIADPVSINMGGENVGLHLLYLIHELVHVITQNAPFCQASLDTQEAIAYFVGNKVLEDILGEAAHTVIDLFTIPWPYDFCRIATMYKGKINLDQYTVVALLEKGIL